MTPNSEAYIKLLQSLNEHLKADNERLYEQLKSYTHKVVCPPVTIHSEETRVAVSRAMTKARLTASSKYRAMELTYHWFIVALLAVIVILCVGCLIGSIEYYKLEKQDTMHEIVHKLEKR
jgi:hypothetical protein